METSGVSKSRTSGVYNTYLNVKHTQTNTHTHTNPANPHPQVRSWRFCLLGMRVFRILGSGFRVWGLDCFSEPPPLRLVYPQQAAVPAHSVVVGAQSHTVPVHSETVHGMQLLQPPPTDATASSEPSMPR